jgi:O-acetyl-ADP-ribose deacetylase (regulator of RNase III)
VVVGDICESSSDVIVNPTDSHLQHANEMAADIRRATDEPMEQQCQQFFANTTIIGTSNTVIYTGRPTSVSLTLYVADAILTQMNVVFTQVLQNKLDSTMPTSENSPQIQSQNPAN